MGDFGFEGSDEEDALDDEELATLRDAGVLATVKSKGKSRRKSTGSASKHVIFVSNENEGEQRVSKDNTVILSPCSSKLPTASITVHISADKSITNPR